MSRDYLAEMTERIVQGFAPLRIVLFGSRARGEGTPQSDYDLLVVMPTVPNKRHLAVAMRRALSDLPVAKDILITTPEEIARRGDLVGTVLRPALREGKTLWSPEAKASGYDEGPFKRATPAS